MGDTTEECYPYEKISEAAEFIKSKITGTPKILIICGSDLGSLACTIQDPININYEDIPNFPVSTTPGCDNKLLYGKLCCTPVIVMLCRFQYYEGFSLQKITMPVRVMKLLGVEYLIIMNGAGSINECFKTGDVMLIKDHINLMGFGGNNPLRGPNDEKFGERFFATNRVYCKNLIKKAKQAACQVGLAKILREGVYTMVCGPNYESVAEVNALKKLGADAVGMSSIPEVLVAAHCGMKVFGFNIITYECVTRYDDCREPNQQEIMQTIEKKSKQLQRFLSALVGDMK